MLSAVILLYLALPLPFISLSLYLHFLPCFYQLTSSKLHQPGAGRASAFTVAPLPWPLPCPSLMRMAMQSHRPFYLPASHTDRHAGIGRDEREEGRGEEWWRRVQTSLGEGLRLDHTDKSPYPRCQQTHRALWGGDKEPIDFRWENRKCTNSGGEGGGRYFGALCNFFKPHLGLFHGFWRAAQKWLNMWPLWLCKEVNPGRRAHMRHKTVYSIWILTYFGWTRLKMQLKKKKKNIMECHLDLELFSVAC